MGCQRLGSNSQIQATSGRDRRSDEAGRVEVTTSIIAHLGNAKGSVCCYCRSGSSVINSDWSTFNKPQAAAVSMDAPQIAWVINCHNFRPVSRSSNISQSGVINAAYQIRKTTVIMTCENINIISIQNRNVAEVAFLSRVCDSDGSYTSLCKVCQVNDAQISISIAAASILHSAQRADI